MEGRRLTNKSFLLVLSLLFFHGLCDSDAEISVMERSEQEALYLMIQGFVGDWWNGSGLYPDPCGWTPIQGVSCDLFNGLWHVTSVSIGPILENSLQCSHNAKFSPQLFELKHLKSLSFFNCFSSLTNLPSTSWDSLSQSLETLGFQSNKGLVGELPPIIGQLVNLQSLVVEENSLSGQLPQELGKLVHLKRLTLSGNRFSGPIPSSLGQNLTELLIMDLSRNSISGSLPPSFGRLASLLKLDISNNLITGTIPREFGDMKSVTLLDLRNNNVSGGLTRSLDGMISIQDMLLSNNPIGGVLNEFGWEKLVNLTNLDLSNTSLIGEIPHSIEKLTTLRFLALNNNQLSGLVPSGLGALPCLNALYLHGNNFSGEIPFPDEFYRRVRRRFATWGNPGLCYGSGSSPVLGVDKCKSEEEEVFGSRNRLSGDNMSQNSDGSSSGLTVCCVIVTLLVVLMQMMML